MKSLSTKRLPELRAGIARKHVEPRTFCDGITADLKVLNAENESRLLLRYAVVMQRLYSYCIQCYPTKKKKSARNDEEFAKVLGGRSKTRRYSYR